jgi:hypothetical protein
MKHRYFYRSLALAAITAYLVFMAVPSLAQTITGNLYLVTDRFNAEDPLAVAHHADPAHVPHRAPDVTFLVSSPANKLQLNFDSANYGLQPGTIGLFLSTGPNPASILAGSSTALNTTISVYNLSGTLIDFTGPITVTTGEWFRIQHDDGVTFLIGGYTVISSPGGAAGVHYGQYKGPSGTFPFRLVYAECNGVDARLIVDANADAPPPFYF